MIYLVTFGLFGASVELPKDWENLCSDKVDRDMSLWNNYLAYKDHSVVIVTG